MNSKLRVIALVTILIALFSLAVYFVSSRNAATTVGTPETFINVGNIIQGN